MQELLWLAIVIDNYIEIIPWKVCMNNFYSQVAMHQQNKQVSEANKWDCDPSQQEPKKIIQALSTVWCFYFIQSEILSYWPKHVKDGKQKTNWKKTFFVQSETWMIVLLGVNLSLFEIKSFFGTYSTFSFILLSLVFATPLCCAIFPQKRLVHCIIGWDTFQFNFLKLKTPKHCSWNCAGLLLKPFIQLLP